MLKIYNVIHDHDYGTDYYKFATDREELQEFASGRIQVCEEGEELEEYLARVPLMGDILTALNINFEPDREESISIEEDDDVAAYIP